MANRWIFPSNNYGAMIGIGEAGIETFKGSPYRSLAREICQNSMDARYDHKKPVSIEFASFEITTGQIPDYVNLTSALNSCQLFWTEQNNKKTVEFFKKAMSVIVSNHVSVLRISDWNTTGLQGSDQEYNTAWHNLVKSAGISGKEGSAGGSFGIGKAAPFACSDLRTIIYATKDIDGLSASQGVAHLVSFRRKASSGGIEMTAGTGYYSSDDHNTPLRECISLDPDYKRKQCGTDIYVLGFHKDTDWKTEIAASIFDEFLLAIFNGELEVKIDEIKIDREHLSQLIERCKERAKTAYFYYQVLTDERAKIIEHVFPGLGTIELRILIQQGLHRKIMICRKNGMKIFDKANISSTIQFAGICLLKDERINAYFREMENPQHNAWEPERHTTDTKTKAKNNLSMLYKYIKNEVIELGKITTVDEVDAEGMGEYFADEGSLNTDQANREEAVSSATSSIEVSIPKTQERKTGYEKSLSGDTDYPDFPANKNGRDIDYGEFGSNDRHDEHAGTGYGNGEGEQPGTRGFGDHMYRSNFNSSDAERSATQIGTMSVRLFLSDRASNLYHLIFIPQKSANRGYLQIDLSGEQSKVKASILTASDLLRSAPLLCSENRIFLDNIQVKKKNKISFQLKYVEECSMEVALYGYPS